MKKLLFSLLLFSISTTSFCTILQITNVGFTFSPSALTIHLGDSVNFTLAASHDAIEVSQATWNANGTTPLPGGFQTAFGGGMVLPAQLTIGTHYYVCENHVGSGMKGTITVQNNAGISSSQMPLNLSVYPNPANNLVTLNAGSDLVGEQYFVTDLAGKQVLNGKLADAATRVDISQLTPGIYLIQVVGQKSSSIKLLKN